ncbi:hypothetical protein [Sodalis sp. dw_96]|uniref:hypothetical protein n=1 Tax=Sodalis sp. dw_96 TaxID=2719794 RepID=UPI001BD49A6F|nr:hypothetical protein [Sodalis sp. dw_96]
MHRDPPAPGQVRKRSKREALPSPRHIRTDSQYRLAVYLNKNAAAGINPEYIQDRQLAIRLLTTLEQQPRLLADLARLTLSGSRLYGERLGETLSPLQQNGLIGQMLCQLIYREDNVSLRVVKLFAAHRHITQRAFAAIVQSWPYTGSFEREKKVWQERYEAPEIPTLYLRSLYKVQDGSHLMAQNQTAVFDLDNLLVGSLTWALMQFGARSIALDDPDKLKSTSSQSLIELGLGLVAMFQQGLLATGVEPTLYLGLVLYYLRARPELGLDELLASGTLDPAFALFKEALERRHLVAQRLYDSFTYYQVNYQRLTWRSRKAAAEELLKEHCGSVQAPITDHDNLQPLPPSYAGDPARRLMIFPIGQQCVSSGKPIPDVNGYYRQEVDRFARKILALDVALLEAAFMSSDVLDNNLQAEEEQFMQRAEIEWVAPRLSRRRSHHDMFYSNVPVNYLAKPDTFFLRVKAGSEQRLFALQTTEQGYVLRKIPLEDEYLNALRPFMADWPLPKLVPQHEFTLLALDNAGLMKRSNETLSVFLERYADSHYQIYRLKIHDQGYEGPGPSLESILDTAADYIVPFYGCISAINAGQHQVAFAECLVDGALVGMPLIFTGIKAGSGLFRAGAIGIGRTLSGPTFSASGQQVFRNVVPAMVQIGGGIVATHAQLGAFMDVMGKEILNIADPGFAALRSLSVLTKGLYLALLGRAALGLNAWQRNLVKVASDIPKFVVTTHTRDYQISYDKDGYTPLTVKVKGVTYPVFQIQNSSMVAVETGERTPVGQLMFAQLDVQNQFGIYKKYYCLYLGSARCQLKAYVYPDFVIEKDAALPRPADEHYFWLLSSQSPISLVVVHPLHLLDFADRQWVVFEINGRRWAFSQVNATLMPADNIDDWQLSPGPGKRVTSMIEPGENDRQLRLTLTPLHGRRKRETVIPRVQDWGPYLTNYTRDEEDIFGFPAVIHDDSTLNVHIGESRYLLTPEMNSATFLLRHPTQPAAPAFRVAYQVNKGDFIFVSPTEPANALKMGEALRRRIAENPQSAREPYIDILLPPLVNGAFSYGNKMFLKYGNRFLHIAPSGGLYHSLSQAGDEIEPDKRDWTLRYELFTGGFDIIDISYSPSSRYKVINGPPSRFERLAMRTYPKGIFSTLSTLCRVGTWPQKNLSSLLYTRLRQVALLLRLDPARRVELLHASSVALRTFQMNNALPNDWVTNFQPLALWATLVKTLDACLSQPAKKAAWSSRQLSQIEGIFWHFPPPVLFAQGAELSLFIVNREPYPTEKSRDEEFEIWLFPERVTAQPLIREDGFRRWLPLIDDIQPTVVTKFTLVDIQQPVFWLDDSNQIWAQTPDGVKTRLFRTKSHHPVDDIIISPDGGTVVLIVERTPKLQRALFYHMPDMGSPAAGVELEFYQEAILTSPYFPGRAWWVTNQGDLYVPWEKHWSFLDEDHPRWVTPEEYQPNFVSPDQRFLGYVKRDGNMHVSEILLFDTLCDKSMLLRRSQPVKPEGYGAGKLISVAFSALNALAAIAFSDGYIEIYSIGGEEGANDVFSLGHANLPLGHYILEDERFAKPKQIVMKFNNAFDQILVLHDVGDFHTDLNGNGTYAISEIYLDELILSQ